MDARHYNFDHTSKQWLPGARRITKVIVHIAQGDSLGGIKFWFENEEKVVGGHATFGYAVPTLHLVRRQKSGSLPTPKTKRMA